MLVRKIDKNGFFIVDVIVDKLERNTDELILEECPGGFYKPRWNGAEWIEGIIEDEIRDIKNVEKKLSQTDLVMLALADLDTQRQQDKLDTQLAIAELTSTLMGGE
ncbi:hypothetical protein [Clostridium intestinale]|uniref:Uncharacterized protein n=1 Tax=Clostridium intestinale DSM 6191 TaxID=1121320 RepID=A0A1M6DZH7_9CLOT|nr:hypothetical protein [Clostridium intestinale]SHI78657.1 hypothetical protein SAMN02745941_04341 [Clostridium intestinale DSM 6191]